MSRPPLRIRSAVIAVCLMVSVSVGPGAASNGTITGVEITGAGHVPTDTDVTTVAGWQKITVTVQLSEEPHGSREVCLGQTSSSIAGTAHCRVLLANSTSATFTFEEWPGNGTGRQTLSVAVTNVSTGESRIRTNETVQVLAPDADADSDGLSNRREVGNATDPLKADTDEDGLDDGTEVAVVGTNPTDSDTDSDGLADGAETGEYGTDPTDSDTDDDGFPDAKELTTGTNPTDSDTDDDGLWDGTEVDTYETDPTDADTDSDGLEDGREVNVYDSDPTVPDTDRDGLSDGAEVNNHDTDPTDSDTDSDGLADGAEVRVHGTDPTDPDTDGDGQSDHTEVVEGGDPAGETDSVPLIGEWRPTTTDGALVTGLVVLVGLGAIVGHRLIRTRRSDEGNDVEIVSDSVPTVATRDDHEFTTDDERLTDPERILQLLEVHGGRLRQSRIVEQTDWSKAKVSRILSKMADEDTITKIRIGRENLVVRSGEEPEFLEPLDDQ